MRSRPTGRWCNRPILNLSLMQDREGVPPLIPPFGTLYTKSTTVRFQRPSPLHPKFERRSPVRNWRGEGTILQPRRQRLYATNFSGGGAYEIRLGDREESPSRELLRVVLRANRRRLSARAHDPSLLLQLQVLPRSLQARLIRTQETCEGIMTIQDENHPVEACDRARMP
jgi:hypothetical protein